MSEVRMVETQVAGLRWRGSGGGVQGLRWRDSVGGVQVTGAQVAGLRWWGSGDRAQVAGLRWQGLRWRDSGGGAQLEGFKRLGLILVAAPLSIRTHSALWLNIISGYILLQVQIHSTDLETFLCVQVYSFIVPGHCRRTFYNISRGIYYYMLGHITCLLGSCIYTQSNVCLDTVQHKSIFPSLYGHSTRTLLSTRIWTTQFSFEIWFLFRMS